MGCCEPAGYGRVFTPGSARRQAQAATRRGVRGTEALLARMAAAHTRLRDATVLEVGAGVGGLTVTLLRRGAAHATALEMTDSYDEAAGQLAREAGVADRVQRRIVDLAREPQAVAPADVVVLHRVVCCYPDHAALLRAAAGRTRRLLLLTLPRERLAVWAGISLGNLTLRLTGQQFRAYAHPHREVLAELAAAGLHPVADEQGLLWRSLALAPVERAGPGPVTA
ncbi:SAM-dependent methyltransferase [Ornithinicoccus halotolerans]|uniref:SAM-dependent methyltransferase n=1 Tax=Ornithinicoccus halotolerans TaxID=1748220 RepID=UPI001296A77D|nr:class I SAM-dependent methyltransferase [Ornithinicoccus halotolerans]